MSNDQAELIVLSDKRRDGIAKLIKISHEEPMNFADALPWEAGLDRLRVPRRPEHSWIVGMPCYDQLTPAQRNEVLWLEVARDVSMFIYLEQILPIFYMGYIHRHPDRLPPEVLEYLMIFSKEEIVHTMVFRRYLQVGQLPLFRADGEALEQAATELAGAHPVLGIIFTLIIEWVAELAAIYSTQDDDIEPLTRELFRRHHVDESRHLAFGRWIVESYLTRASDAEREEARNMIHTLLAEQIRRYTYNPDIALFTSFDFPVARDDESAIESILNSPANMALNEHRFAPIYQWLRKLELE